MQRKLLPQCLVKFEFAVNLFNSKLQKNYSVTVGCKIFIHVSIQINLQLVSVCAWSRARARQWSVGCNDGLLLNAIAASYVK